MATSFQICSRSVVIQPSDADCLNTGSGSNPQCSTQAVTITVIVLLELQGGDAGFESWLGQWFF
jgi:hypothetical protein